MRACLQQLLDGPDDERSQGTSALRLMYPTETTQLWRAMLLGLRPQAALQHKNSRAAVREIGLKGIDAAGDN